MNRKGRGFDVVSAINSITPKNIEYHIIDQGDDGVIRKSNFVGPNTNLEKRLKNYDRLTGSHDGVNTPPINALDRGAMFHDIAYHDKSLEVRHKADEALVKVADQVINDVNAKAIQKANARLVKGIMKGKMFLGVGVGLDRKFKY